MNEIETVTLYEVFTPADGKVYRGTDLEKIFHPENVVEFPDGRPPMVAIFYDPFPGVSDERNC